MITEKNYKKVLGIRDGEQVKKCYYRDLKDIGHTIFQVEMTEEPIDVCELVYSNYKRL